jgi:TolB-like protein/Flp pilus assembly protein TadD
MQGIATCRVFVLVFTDHANDSEHVGREVANAFSLGLTVIPFRIEAVNPREHLGYFLQTVQWFDAATPPLQKHISSLAEHVSGLLSIDRSSVPATIDGPPERKAERTSFAPTTRWIVGICLLAVAAVIAVGWLFFSANRSSQRTASSTDTQKTLSSSSIPEVPTKSIAVLPFESLSANKDDTYFADGVQDEILNNLAKIAQLTVISRTSVMQYRADEKRDLRQIANALGVANVLEGTVRRNGNRVRVSIELIDARHDKTTWADSFDRDLTDIFAIQSEVAQTIATKLAATLSPEEKQNIEKKLTENLEAYDLYLRAKGLIASTQGTGMLGYVAEPMRDAIPLVEQAERLDPKFTLAYCLSAKANAGIYHFAERTPERRTLADAAISSALRLQPDLPEVHLAYAYNLYWVYRDYERARVQLAMARRALPNDAGAIALAAYMDRRQGNFEKAIREFNEAIARDPRNIESIAELGNTLFWMRQFRASEQACDRLTELLPDQPMIRVQNAFNVAMGTGDDTLARSTLAALPASMADDNRVLCWRLRFALKAHDWQQAKELIGKMKGAEDDGNFSYGSMPVPVGCYSILLARLQGEQPGVNASFAETREKLSQKVQKAPGSADLLSQLAVVDALLNNKEIAVSEAKRAVELLPISKDALEGPLIELNLAVVYAWTNQPGLAFKKLSSLTKVPNGIYYGQLKRDPQWEPLRQDLRYQELLAELAPRD